MKKTTTEFRIETRRMRITVSLIERVHHIRRAFCGSEFGTFKSSVLRDTYNYR